MRIAFAAASLAMLALAACGDETVADPTDPDSVAAASANLPDPEPGQYRSVGELVEFEVADAPAEQTEMLREMMGQMFSQPQEQCMTEAEAEEGYRGFIEQMNDNQSCELQNYETTSSTFTARLACSQDGAEHTVDVNGEVSGTSMDMTMAMQGNFPQMGETRMVLRMQSERIGDCPAEGAAEG